MSSINPACAIHRTWRFCLCQNETTYVSVWKLFADMFYLIVFVYYWWISDGNQVQGSTTSRHQWPKCLRCLNTAALESVIGIDLQSNIVKYSLQYPTSIWTASKGFTSRSLKHLNIAIVKMRKEMNMIVTIDESLRKASLLNYKGAYSGTQITHIHNLI